MTIKYEMDQCSPEQAKTEQSQLKSSLCNKALDCEFTHVTAHCYLFIKGVSHVEIDMDFSVP